MDESTCKSCKHFRLHYIKIGNNHFTPISYGHCVFPRLKKRDSDTPACKNFRERARSKK